MELDHAIWFVPSLAAVEAELNGFTVEAGRRHTEQGTANRRVVFARSYLEVLWIEDPATLAARGLGFAARCAWEAGACPFGVVLRGPLPERSRGAFTRYELPDAPGLALWLLTASLTDAALPFVAVFEVPAAEQAARQPARWAPSGVLTHVNGASSLELATLAATTPPTVNDGVDLGGALGVRDVRFVAGAPRLRLALAGLCSARTLAGQLVIEPA